MQTRYVRRRRPLRFAARRPKKFQWVHEEQTFSVAGTNTLAALDLLAPYKTQFGISLNLPDVTIWGLLVKITIRFTWPAFTPSDGWLYAFYVDNADLPFVLTPVNHQFDHHYQLYERAFTADLLQYQQGVIPSPGTNGVYTRSHQIKTRRKLVNQNESQLFSIGALGAIANPYDGVVQYHALLKLP